jgi:hypothetical protein
MKVSDEDVWKADADPPEAADADGANVTNPNAAQHPGIFIK